MKLKSTDKRRKKNRHHHLPSHPVFTSGPQEPGQEVENTHTHTHRPEISVWVKAPSTSKHTTSNSLSKTVSQTPVIHQSSNSTTEPRNTHTSQTWGPRGPLYKVDPGWKRIRSVYERVQVQSSVPVPVPLTETVLHLCHKSVNSSSFFLNTAIKKQPKIIRKIKSFCV